MAHNCGAQDEYCTGCHEEEVAALKLQVRELQKENDRMRTTLLLPSSDAVRLNGEYLDLLEWAWSGIASAGPEGCIGNWKKMDPDWVLWAERWREKWHKILRDRAAAKEQQTEKRVEPSPKKCENCGHVGNDVTKPVFNFGFDFLCHACDRISVDP